MAAVTEETRLQQAERLGRGDPFREAIVAAVYEAHGLAKRIDALEARALTAEGRLATVEAAALGAAPQPADPQTVRADLAAALAPGAVGSPRGPVRAELLSTAVGELYYPADDTSVTPWVRDFGTWEEEECRALEGLLAEGMTFLDIGAHVGYLTLLAARAVGPSGRGVAVEPAPDNHALLTANLARAGVAHVTTIAAAAWRETCTLSFTIDPSSSGDHRAVPVEGLATIQVPAIALDDVWPAGAPLDVVKVDTQGTDHVVLEGLRATIRRCRPALLVEFWPPGITEAGDDPSVVLAFYEDELDYPLALVDGTTCNRDGALAAAAAAPGGYCTLLLR